MKTPSFFPLAARLRAALCALVMAASLSGGADALQIVLTNPDRDFQPVAAGESSGGRLTLQLSPGFSGPVSVVVQEDDGGTKTYSGSVRDGQVTVQGQSLAKFLAARNLTLTIQILNGKPFTLPGTRSAPRR